MNLTEEQRQKVREFILLKLGWELIPTERPSHFGHLVAINPEGKTAFAPDYCASLDACHEAEKTLKGDQWIGYVRRLGEATQEEKGRCHATAEQRALALFQTLGGVL